MTGDDFKQKLSDLGVRYEMTAGQIAIPCKRCRLGHIVISPSGGNGGCTGEGCLKRLTFEDAIAICEGKPVISNEQTDAKHNLNQLPILRIVAWSEFEKREFPANAWRVNNLIPLNGTTIIAAPSGEKKSWVVMGIARAVAEGQSFLGNPEFAVQQTKVLYIENETPRNEVHRRGKMLGFGADIYLAEEECPPLNTDAGVAQLLEIARAQNIGLIIIDTFRSVAAGLKEEKADEVRAFFQRFNKFSTAKITVIFTDHCRKPHQLESKSVPKKEQLFGSQDKLAAVHALIMVKSEKNSEDIYVHPLKMKAGKERVAFRMVMKDEGDTITFSFGGDVDEQKLTLDRTKEFIHVQLEEATDMLDTKQLVDALEGQAGKTNVETALKEMRESHEIRFEKIGRKFIYGKLSEDSKEGSDNDSSDAPMIPFDELPNVPLGS
jgi:AAA domain